VSHIRDNLKLLGQNKRHWLKFFKSSQIIHTKQIENHILRFATNTTVEDLSTSLKEFQEYAPFMKM